MYEQNVISSQTQLDNIKHEQTIFCRQLFAGQVMGSRPMKRKKNLHWMILTFDYKETPSSPGEWIFFFLIHSSLLSKYITFVLIR